MPRYSAHPYRGTPDLALLIRFAQDVSRMRRPGPPYYHPGDFVWQLYALGPSENVRLWLRADGNALAACAIFEPPLTFQFDVDPLALDQTTLLEQISGWARERRASVVDKQHIPLAYQRLGSDTISTSAFDGDSERIAFLQANGFVREEKETFLRLARNLNEPLPATLLPHGAQFRRMTADDADARSELHRDAWSVWGQSPPHNRDVSAAPFGAAVRFRAGRGLGVRGAACELLCVLGGHGKRSGTVRANGHTTIGSQAWVWTSSDTRGLSETAGTGHEDGDRQHWDCEQARHGSLRVGWVQPRAGPRALLHEAGRKLSLRPLPGEDWPCNVAGTPEGTNTPLDAGDGMEVEVEGIGVLRNLVGEPVRCPHATVPTVTTAHHMPLQ